MIKNFLDSDEEPEPDSPSAPGGSPGSPPETKDDDLVTDPETGEKEPFILAKSSTPESVAETARRSGLAYSAGIAFFASVVFMLVIGWGADLLLGSSPWGIVFGLVLGSIIGFVQFFRITSRIFRPETDNSAPKSLFDRNDPEK